MSIHIDDLLREFRSRTLKTEDDVKIYAYSDIFSPIQKEYAPHTTFQSERTFVKGGRADGTIANLVIEYKSIIILKEARVSSRRYLDVNKAKMIVDCINIY